MAERERVGVGGLRRHVASFSGAVRAQVALTRQNVEDLRPILTMPLVALMGLAVLLHAGRPDLAPYALVAATLMTLGQMGNFVASEVVFQDRFEQTLELMVASPAPYFTVLAERVLVLTLLGMVGVARFERVDFEGAEAPLLARLSEHTGVASVRALQEGKAHRVELAEREALPGVLALLVETGITQIRTSRPSLEEVYVHVIGDRGLTV